MGQQTLAKEYDYFIIGGGIVGSGIFRELCLRQESVAIVDKADFSSQTSQASSKMLHGGIRYLENFDFMLVREALKEKKLWLQMAPHLTKEEMFTIPVYQESKWPLFFVRVGLFLYDLLSLFKNPKRRVLNRKQTLITIPGLKEENLKGAGVYSDAIVEDAKLGLECIYDGIAHGGSAFNYHEVKNIDRIEEKKWKITVSDTLNNEQFEVLTQHLIFATGPFTDQVLNKLNIPWRPRMILSKGAHIWLRPDALNIKGPTVLQTSDNRVLFVIPQRNAILAGTTEDVLPVNTDIFNIKATPKEIHYILNAIDNYFPAAQLSEQDVIASFAGVRPLVGLKGQMASSKISRKHKIFTPQEDLYVIIGGKYTTFRVMAEDMVKFIYKRENKKFIRGLSKKPLARSSIIGMTPPQDIDTHTLKRITEEELVRTSQDLSRRLSKIR